MTISAYTISANNNFGPPFWYWYIYCLYVIIIWSLIDSKETVFSDFILQNSELADVSLCYYMI